MGNSTCSERRSLSGLPDVLSVDDVAEALGVARSTVRRWIRSGELPTLDLSGDRRLIPKQALLDLVAEANGRRRKCGAAP